MHFADCSVIYLRYARARMFRALVLIFVLSSCHDQAASPPREPASSAHETESSPSATHTALPTSASSTASANVAPSASAVPPLPMPVVASARPMPPQMNVAPYDTSCTGDWQCTPAPSCCSVPCTHDVINVKELERARANMYCPSTRPPCPSAGACPTFSYLCVEKKCRIVFANEPGFRKPNPQPAGK